jgi:anti-sigma factor ChrR (cupin superfamily)
VHPNDEEIDRFAARQAGASEATAIRRHLLGCPECRERLRASPFYPEQGRRESETIANLKERAGCPEPSARVAYAVDSLSPERRTQIAEHARACPDCARDLRALQALREGARAEGERRGCLLAWWGRRQAAGG